MRIPLHSRFELFVALRYLTAKRKQAVISVITAISILGVAAGVMALVIALAINAGFRNTLQRNLLSATAHVTVLEKDTNTGIENWRELSARLKQVPRVVEVSPALIGPVMLTGPMQSSGGFIKGILPPDQVPIPEVLTTLKQGKLKDWRPVRGHPPIILGSELARRTGMRMDSLVRVLSPMGEITPYGPRLVVHQFRVRGIFESGFYDLDANYAFASLPDVQRVLSVDDVVNVVELRIDDIYAAPEVASGATTAAGKGLDATTWMDQNAQLLSALKMERVVTVITIGLIQMVAALNILISLIMMVMEKHRDIAILMSMGARKEQISRLFQLQGVLIGVAGIILGLAAGYTLCYFADRGRWVQLDASVYALSFVPFEPRWLDGAWISAAALLVSFLATVYPARSAARIAPAEALRYE
jgi:lipoprotein-releasing system permease protein